MNAKQKINSLIQLEEGESVAKTYNTVPSKDHSFKKIFLPSFLITTAIFFLSFLYIVVFCGEGEIKKGSMVYDTTSYWVVIAFLVVAYVAVTVYVLLVALSTLYLNSASSKVATSKVACALTSRKIVIMNTEKTVVLASIPLSSVESVMRYVDNQLKVICADGKDYILSIDDPADFLDTYPGLWRSENHRARMLSKENLGD